MTKAEDKKPVPKPKPAPPKHVEGGGKKRWPEVVSAVT